MKLTMFMQVAILALLGMTSAMSIVFYTAGDNCWPTTDVSNMKIDDFPGLILTILSTSAATIPVSVTAAARPTRSASRRP